MKPIQAIKITLAKKLKMKNLNIHLILILLVLSSAKSVGQTKEEKNNEIKINTLALIAFGAIDITYERVLNHESSIGLSVYVLGQNNLDAEVYRTFSITPYYRSYFSKQYNKGFFIELFGMYYERKDEYYLYNSYDYTDSASYYNNYATTTKYNGGALGISVGGKWVTKRGFIAEINAGLGRVMTSNNDEVPVVGRGGIIIGKRF